MFLRKLKIIVLVLVAPKNPPEWFEPKMPPRPEFTEEENSEMQLVPGNFLASCRKDPDLNKRFNDLQDWNRESHKEKLIQWPIAWAEMVLEKLGETNGRDR